MAFSEALKLKVKKNAHMSCCLCHALGVEVHHIIPQEENGPDTEENAAPLCPSCHEIYGANPQKRKFIREARDFWYEICAKRYASDANKLDEIKTLLQNTVSLDDFQKFKEELLSQRADNLLTKPQLQSNVRNGFLFIGLYPTDGYRWDADLRPAPGLVTQEGLPEAPWLVSKALGVQELSRSYSIFEEKNVLRDFANLSPTGEAIQQFANSHGYLADVEDLVPLYYPNGKPDNKLWAGESLQFWTREIREMNMLVSLWDMIKDKQVEALKEHIIWKLDSMGVIFEWQYPDLSVPKKTLIASDKHLPKLFHQWKWGEVIRPALHYLCTEINAHMRGHINPTLYPSSEVEMYMVPDSFGSSLYVLLSMEVREHRVEAE
jgi:hypothetical protein